MAPLPCHALFQFYVADGKLSCQPISAQRISSLMLFHASYGLATLMVAQVCGLQPATSSGPSGDCYLYANHIEQTDGNLRPKELPPLPTMVPINPEVRRTLAFKFEDFGAGLLSSAPAYQRASGGLTIWMMRLFCHPEVSFSGGNNACRVLIVRHAATTPRPAERTCLW
jgi:hypothetical protein